MKNFEYISPRSLSEALAALDKWKTDARILAGGTDLIVQMKDGQISPAAIIDVKNIPDLNWMEWNENSWLFIGAAVPLSRVLTFPAIKKRFGFLRDACALIGSYQLKNRGTLGGNICNAAPSADSAGPLLCLGAKAMIAGVHGNRRVALEDFFLGPGRTVLAENEILVGIEVPCPPDSSYGCYLRHTPRQDMDIGVVGVASFLIKTPSQDLCQKARITLTSVAPTPIRVPRAEDLLKGQALTVKLMTEAAEIAAEVSRPISDIRASAGYRREMVKVLTRRTLEKAWEGQSAPTQ